MMDGWQLWDHGKVLKEAAIEPRLASWNKKTDPEQIALSCYFDTLVGDFGPLLAGRDGLFLHMDSDVKVPDYLLHHHDLENYLTPVVARLGSAHFTLASARKDVGGGSRLTVGEAVPREMSADPQGWDHFSYPAGSGPTKTAWKAGLRDALAVTHPRLLPAGPVETHLAWRCSPRPNWVWLWKPTGDAMGPVLGEPDTKRPFNPADDRITFLGLHLNPDESMGNDVDVGMWWRPVAARA